MALTLTLAQLRSEVGLCLDIPIGDAYLPNAVVDQWLNMAVQEYAAHRAAYGLSDQKRTTLTGSVSTTAGADGFPANEVLALPSDFAAVVSLSLNYQGLQRPLQLMAESDRQRYVLTSLTTYGPPELYEVVDATPSLTARSRVWPPMQSAYTFELIYRPQVTTLTLDADTWEYLPGTADLVVCCVALKQATREGIQEPQQYQAIQQRYDRALAALQRMSARGGGVGAMRDTRSARFFDRFRRGW